MSDLEQRVKTLEAKVKILEETLETLKNMGLSEKMESFIKQKKQTLKMVSLINSVSEKPSFDFDKEEETIAHMSQAKRTIDDQIRIAVKEAGTFSDDLPGDSRYFEYELETGVEHQFDKLVKRADIEKYINSGIRITSYNGFNQKRIIIPREINGMPVISIGEKAFMNSVASEIILPNSLKIIMQEAFSGCKNLAHIDLPENLEFIRREAFLGSGLIKACIPPKVKLIPNRCFCLCKNLKSIVLGEQVTEIQTWAFWGTSIKKIIFPETVESVAFDAFSQKSISIHDCVDIECAFMGKNTEVHIPDYENFNKVSAVYCVAGSKIQKTAREHNIRIRPLNEFTMEG